MTTLWWDRAQIAAQLARAGLRALFRDTEHPSPVSGDPRFRSARDAALLIADGDVVGVSGMGAHQHASIVYAALRERFDATGHPRCLTLVNVGGHGGRGIAPGTLEELGRPGLCTRLITSHFETFRAMLDLADAGKCELQCVPFGVLALLFEALGRGEQSVISRTGVGTFLDPRLGRGSPVTGRGAQLVTAEGDQLRYRIPPIDVAILNAPAADRRGNLYVKNCAVICESRELARAARRHGGKVIANVGLLVDEGYAPIFLAGDAVDAVVVHPDTEQTAGIAHRGHWPMFTTESDVPLERALARVRFVNSLLPALPRRSAADVALARLAAATLLANVERGAVVSIGTGLPEEVAPALFAAGRHRGMRFRIESGVEGGLPAPGLFFGAGLCPDEIISSAELFRRCEERLDATCLGALEVDGSGDVNVSKRGDGAKKYVGPGGFCDFCAAAGTIVFVFAWMRGGRLRLEDGELRIAAPGTPKLVERAGEVSFRSAGALAAGKRVLYVTHVGVFQLVEDGLALVCAMPGIDVRRDILDAAPVKLRVPARVPRVPRSIVEGRRLAWRVLAAP